MTGGPGVEQRDFRPLKQESSPIARIKIRRYYEAGGMIEWIQGQEAVFWWLMASSLVFFVITLIGTPVLAVRIPPDYFVKGRRKELGERLPHPLRSLFKIGKNLLGALLIVAGIAMLLLPGQGIFSILIGLMLLDFPGKRRAIRWIVSRPSVFQAINKLRRRYGRPPLVLEA